MAKTPEPASRRRIKTMAALSETIGVSRPTLSRYFQDADSVRHSTRERIERALVRVDYVPNFFATRMNRKHTRLIGVIIPYYNDLFFTNLLGSIEMAALEAGYTIVSQSSHGQPSVEARAADTLHAMGVDGVIVAPLGRSSSTEAMARLSGDLPFVFVDSRVSEGLSGIDFVGTDNHQSMGLIIDYLCRTGTPPAFLGMPAINSNALERERAYRERMHLLGHPPELLGHDVTPERWDFEAYARDVMDTHFARGAYCSATILCANDRLAIGVINAAHRHGLFGRREGRPSALRIAGHDDHPLSDFVTPALTTVAQDAPTIGRTVVSRLLERISAERPVETDGIETRCDATLKVRMSA